MIILKGKNLGERQKEFNALVKEAVSNNVDFSELKDKTELSDLDKLFKIDIASKYRNISYIIEVLKSGDDLHISRALKCTWLYEDEFANIVSAANLKHNVFPFMSLKMKKKLLTTISVHIRNSERALAFYKYCSGTKLTNIALKFLIFTSDEFKLKFIKENTKQYYELRYKNDFKHFIGGSFTLADEHIATLLSISCKKKAFSDISHLYSVSDIKYLDMLEKHLNGTLENQLSHHTNLGLRISKDILTKHKDRVLNNPLLYINYLNKSSIVKYSSVEHAKVYLPALLPADVEMFWSYNFCGSYEHILNILPALERFGFIKKLFNDKYPDNIFEMHIDFYNKHYYKFMTVEEKEKWALEQLASKKEILGIGNDYIWYKFMTFEIAFKEIRKLIMVTTDIMRRAEILEILIRTAKSQRDLEKLFKYYYERHNNEQRHIKENFMDSVIRNHNVYKFDKECWAAFDQIFQNLDLYNMSDYNTYRSGHALIALIYNVINKMKVHEALNMYISSNLYFYALKQNTERLYKEQQEMVYKYLYAFYMDKINELDAKPYEDTVKHQVRKYIYFILDLLQQYNKSKNDIPEVVMKLMKLDWNEFEYHALHRDPPQKQLTQDDYLRFLKKDATLAVDHLPVLKKAIENTYGYHLGQLLKKLKIYFPNDIAKDYLKFFIDMLKQNPLYTKAALAATYGVFQLADESFKVDFMTKHAPLDKKVNKLQSDPSLLQIQQAICATAFYSRPPVPLKNMLMYIKGDYVPYCLPLFNAYLVNLPLPQCIEFVEQILNKPISIQKHGVRLAFACFNTENLRKLLLYVWKKTKNVSLRMIIYKALYNQIVSLDEHAQTALFETLITFTSQLHHEDSAEVFNLLTSGRLPKYLMSDYMNAVWTTVSALPKTALSLQRMTDVIKYMYCNIEILRQDVVRPIVNEFVTGIFDSDVLSQKYHSLSSKDLTKMNWILTAKHITYVQNQDDLENKLDLTKFILNKCLSNINLVDGDSRYSTYFVRNLCYTFIGHLRNCSYECDFKYNDYVDTIFENVLEILQASLPIEETYMNVWEIRIDTAARKAISDAKNKLSNTKDKTEKSKVVKDIVIKFGNDIGCLIEEYVKKDIYFGTFMPNIKNIFIGMSDNIASFIPFDIISREDVLVLASAALMEFKMTETFMFALDIVPSDYSSQYEEDFKSVINEIRKLDNIEIKCKFFEKFVNSDFKARPFIQL